MRGKELVQQLSKNDDEENNAYTFPFMSEGNGTH
jgi:hypothetical protein